MVMGLSASPCHHSQLRSLRRPLYADRAAPERITPVPAEAHVADQRQTHRRRDRSDLQPATQGVSGNDRSEVPEQGA